MKKKNAPSVYSKMRRRWRLLAVLVLALGFVAFSFSPLVVRNMDDLIYKGENHLLDGLAMEEVLSYWDKDDWYEFSYAVAYWLEDEEERKAFALELTEDYMEYPADVKPDPYRAPGSHCHVFRVPRLVSHAICWFIFW